MAFFTSIQARGVGLVEIFLNPGRREWRDLATIADPVDGVRGYLVGSQLYLWGSLPLHRDLRPHLKSAIGDGRGAVWIGLQIIPRMHSVTITECSDSHGRPLHIVGIEEIVAQGLPLTRIIGDGFTTRLLGNEAQAADLDP